MTSQRERIKIGAAALWNLPTESEGRNRRQLVEKSIPMLGDIGRFAHVDRRWCRLAGNGGEIRFDQGPRLRHIEGAGNRQHRVVGGVINAKELAYIFDRRRIQVFHRSDSRMRISMVAKTHFEQAQK